MDTSHAESLDPAEVYLQAYSRTADGRCGIDAGTCESSVASFGCEHGRTSFQGVEVHDVSLPGGSARARSQGVNDVLQISTKSHCARLTQREWIEDRLDDGDGQRRQVRTDPWS